MVMSNGTMTNMTDAGGTEKQDPNRLIKMGPDIMIIYCLDSATVILCAIWFLHTAFIAKKITLSRQAAWVVMAFALVLALEHIHNMVFNTTATHRKMVVVSSMCRAYAIITAAALWCRCLFALHLLLEWFLKETRGRGLSHVATIACILSSIIFSVIFPSFMVYPENNEDLNTDRVYFYNKDDDCCYITANGSRDVGEFIMHFTIATGIIILLFKTVRPRNPALNRNLIQIKLDEEAPDDDNEASQVIPSDLPLDHQHLLWRRRTLVTAAFCLVDIVFKFMRLVTAFIQNFSSLNTHFIYAYLVHAFIGAMFPVIWLLPDLLQACGCIRIGN